MSDLFKTITGDDWKRSIATARKRGNKVAAQIRAYSVAHDTYFDAKTGVWLEGVCEDKGCRFCKNRPAQAGDDLNKRAIKGD